MKKRNWIISALMLAVLVLPTTSYAAPADDFNKGKSAYKAGDFKQAAEYYRLASEQGYAKAQNKLGIMYEFGRGVVKNDKQAVHYYRLAAEQGYAQAQTSLGVMYYTGHGVAKNEQTAYKWFLLSAAQGDDFGKKLLKPFEKRLNSEQRAAGQEAAAQWQKAFDAR